MTRSRGMLLLLFLLLTLVVINASQWFVVRRATSALDDELGRRLKTVALAAVSEVTESVLLDPDVGDDFFARSQLDSLARRHDIDDIFLMDSDGIVLFELPNAGTTVDPFQAGGDSRRPLAGARSPSEILELDVEAFSRAVAGAPSASRILNLDGEIFKAAYAPVSEYDEFENRNVVSAVLGVTAGGGFHQNLPRLERTAWGITIGSAALILVLAAIFFGVLRRLSATEGALARAETLSAMGMMAAGVAHEVRNPLAIIAGTAQRLRRKYQPDDAEPDELFEFIPGEVERLNGILEGYLRFARDEPLAFGDSDLAAVVQRSVGMVRDEFAEREIRVDFSGTEAAAPLSGDPQRLQQVLLNLLLNAAQAMPQGGEVRITLERPGDLYRLTVEDDGSGFDSKALKGDAAFQPFFTTKEQGSGLGLAMSKRIVEGHGGTIAVGNHGGGGARVVVELPRSGTTREEA